MAMMNDLKNPGGAQKALRVKLLDDEARRGLCLSYRNAGRRLLFLDYDGTLVSFSHDPGLAVPSQDLLALISRISSTEGNELYIISGRSRDWLEQHFGQLPVHLAAEHGACHRNMGNEWVQEAVSGNDWKSGIRRCMETFVRRCADSFIEEKEYSLVWHYRNAVNEEGERHAIGLAQELAVMMSDDLQVLKGHKIVEVRQGGMNKGAFAQKIMASGNYDFVLAVGDDRTDEDMFMSLPSSEHVYTIKVGVGSSHARYYVSSPYMVMSLLKSILSTDFLQMP